MQPVEAVLFDFGMVLSLPPVPAVWAEMQRVSGLDEATLHRFYWQHRDSYDEGALDGPAYWNTIAQGGGRSLSDEQKERLLALDVDLWTDMNLPMLAWVKLLHRAGVRTGILSNMPGAMAEGIVRRFDWISDFHHAVWSHALRLRKPQQEIYAAATEGLGVPANRILFIDDKEENIHAAQRFGMQGIVYRDHHSFLAEMEERGFHYLLDPTHATATA
ncbi:HAD family hydrolase [Terriglobus aquaticus]|uniref:HAD family hydrolase n=1 Tax=Terriglobus aquaticus TaxID=940139 RepID=A0ABW9KKY1_9BACT|nr:HAD family phosphatase [Terriglobus aquaticus]